MTGHELEGFAILGAVYGAHRWAKHRRRVARRRPPPVQPVVVVRQQPPVVAVHIQLPSRPQPTHVRPPLRERRPNH